MPLKEAIKKNWKEIVFAKILVIVESVALFVCGLLYTSNVITFTFAVCISAVTVLAVISNFIALVIREKVLFIDELEIRKRYKCLSKTTMEDFNDTIYVLEQLGNKEIIIVKAKDMFIPTNRFVRVSIDKTRLEPSDLADSPCDERNCHGNKNR